MSGEGPRRRSNLVRALTAVAILMIGMGVIWVGLRFALGTPTPFFVVSSGSMEPTLMVGDIIIVQDGRGYSGVHVGDIVVFERPKYGGRILVHRVFDIVKDDTGVGLITKGDNNVRADSWVVRESDYIGRVVFTVPKLGYVTAWIQPPFNYAIIIAILVAIFASEYYSRRASAGSNDQSKSQHPEA